MSTDAFEKIEKGIIVSVMLSILVYVAFVIFTGWENVADNILRVGIPLVLLLLLLSVMNYAFRFYRWHALLLNAKIRIKWTDSLKAFLSGLCLTITPGKAGELFKASFVKDYAGVSRLKVVPIVVVERVFDLAGFAMILLFSLAFFSYEGYTFTALYAGLAVFAVMVGLIIFLKTKLAKKLAARVIDSASFLKKRKEVLMDAFNDYASISFAGIIFIMLLSFVGWFFETIELYLLLAAFGVDASIFAAGFVYGLSSLAGILTFTPGGIIGFEASSGLLMNSVLGVPLGEAAAITLIVRLTTLWFAVIIGLVSYLRFSKRINV